MSHELRPLERLRLATQNSPFSTSSSYEVLAPFVRIFTPNGNLFCYNNAAHKAANGGEKNLHKLVALMTPKFQRCNKIWSQEMQIGFVENILSGCNSVIKLFEIKSANKLEHTEWGGCGIIDGLQRTTALAAFQMGEFKVFGDLSYADLINDDGKLPFCKVFVSIYEFHTVKEAVTFYIQMNKGITHSESDLITAYEHLDGLSDDAAVYE